MKIEKNRIVEILAEYNPWWRQEPIISLPKWRRAVFEDFFSWINHRPTKQAIFLSGARQIGKTTLLQQVIDRLLHENVPAANILYVTLDHPVLKLAGIDQILEAWREREPRVPGPEYLFLDEVQFMKDWETWVKHQVDFHPDRHIAFTGSAIPVIEKGQETGVGRWHTIRLTTLSFYEYCKLRNLILPILPELRSLASIYDWSPHQWAAVSEKAGPFVGHFHEYLLRGGFPRTAQVESIDQAQQILREDIIDKVLKRDMTAIFGVRNILELENTFLYLCMHPGGVLDFSTLTQNLQANRQTAENFLQILEAAHLIYRLRRHGYGKEVLRSRMKIYLADPAIATAVMLRGKSWLNHPDHLSVTVESAIFKHLFTHFYKTQVRFTYWQDKKQQEVDMVAEYGTNIVPFEVKYSNQHTDPSDFKGLISFCEEKSIDRAYVITKSARDVGRLENGHRTRIVKIPAPLFCYWMGEMELQK